MTVDERARAGLFLAMQYPVEVPGVTRVQLPAHRGHRGPRRGAEAARRSSRRCRRRWTRCPSTPTFAERNVNEGFSGGEKKRHEILQLELLEPEDRDPRRDRLRAGHRRAAGGLRGRSTGSAPARARRAAHHPLHPDPALHQAGLRPRVHGRPDRRVGRARSWPRSWRTRATSGSLKVGGGDVTLDVARIRKDFPILDRLVHDGKPLVYLDSANTSQKPRQVIDAMSDYYERHNANVHRGVHALGEEATAVYEGARTRSPASSTRRRDEVVFTKNASEALNLVAYAMGNAATASAARTVPARPRRRDRHHRDGAPLQHRPVAAAVRSAPARRCAGSASPTTAGSTCPQLDELITERTKIVSFAHRPTSSARSTRSPRSPTRAHAVGALVLVDASQAVPHLPVDVHDAGCRLPRLHRPQDVRPDRHRRAVGPARAARGRCRRSWAAAR